MLFKVCTKCGKEQSVAFFSKHANGKHGVRPNCKTCERSYRQENKDAIALSAKMYVEKNKDDIVAYKKAYRQLNKEALAFKDKKYKQDNHHKVNAINANRKAIKLQATPSWTDKEAIAGMYQLAAIFNSTGINLHVDHIVPLKSNKVCGLHSEDNLRLLPATENITKGNRYWDDMWTTT